jgi:predicted enzyme related to lactoylglutathione lyase
MKIGISIDVDDLEHAVEFYTRGLGLSVIARGRGWAHLDHEGQTIFIMQLPQSSDAVESAHSPRDYSRHWTPVHLDFVVADVDQAVERALAAGAELDRPILRRPKLGDMANMADPR